MSVIALKPNVLFILDLLIRLLIGNVKDIIDQSKAAQDEYLNRFDQIRQYMVAMNVPTDTMDRIKQWCQVNAHCTAVIR